VASPASNLAFITYKPNNPGSWLPYYIPNTNGTPGTLDYLQLAGSAVTAPLAGAFSPDDKYFFVSTAGDNMIHYISIPNLTYNLANPGKTPLNTDTQQISPNLPACTPGSLEPGCNFTGTGAYVPATFIAVKPRATT